MTIETKHNIGDIITVKARIVGVRTEKYASTIDEETGLVTEGVEYDIQLLDGSEATINEQDIEG